MGKKGKKKKKKEARLEKKLRKLAKQDGTGTAGMASAAGEHTDVANAAAAVAPAEVQLGGGQMIGSLEQVGGATQAVAAAAPSALTPGTPSGNSRPQPFDLVEGRPAYDLFVAVQGRRSHKHFLKRAVPRRALEVMFEAAVLAPNHKLTEPWGFVVLGEQARRRYGAIRAQVKVGEDAEGMVEKRARIIDEVVAIPTIVAVTMRVDDDAVRREEDYAATFMAVENLLLAGAALGLGTKINTGRIMDHPELRALVGVREDERVVALINVGVPAETRGPAPRAPASDKTSWLD